MNTEREPEFGPLFRPRGVAYVGVPRRGRTLGGLALQFGIKRPGRATISAVHPELPEVQGVSAYPRITDVSGPVDVAFVAVPAERAQEVIEDCGTKGVKFAIVGSSGFAESGTDGAEVQRRLVAAARDGGVRLVGPNCNGIWSVPDQLSVGFNTTHGAALRPGSISVVGQTGAVLGSFLAGVVAMNGGIAYAVSTGNEADVDAAECFLNVVALPETRVVALLLDSITRPELFEEAAHAARARGVPVVVYRFGRSAQGRHAAELHSSRVAGGDRAFSAWLDSLGIVEAPNIEAAMFAATLLEAGHGAGSVGAISTSGAGAAMMADLAEVAGVPLPAFSAQTDAKLAGLYKMSQPFNPLDLAGQANDREWLRATMDAVFTEPGIDTVVLLSTLLPSKEVGVAPVVSAFAEVASRHSKTACVYAVGPLAAEHRSDLTAAGIPVADSGATLFDAIQTVRRMQNLSGRSRASNVSEPVRYDVDFAAVPAGGLVLHDEVQDRLEPLGISFLPMAVAATGEEAAARFVELGGRPVAMKLLDRALPHKAQVGGVILGVPDRDQAARAGDTLMAAAVSSDARVLLQPMTPCPVEIFIGTVSDPVAGPVVVVGRGGSDVEKSPDVRVHVAPVTKEAAVGMVREVDSVMEALRTLARLSREFDLETCLDRIAQAVVTVAQVAATYPSEIQSIDLNPLVVAEDGNVAALDARIQLSTARTSAKIRRSQHD